MTQNSSMPGTRFSSQHISYDGLEDEIKAAYATLDKIQAVKRIFAKDPTLWKMDSADQKSISNRLGWLILPDNIDQKTNDLIAFAKEVKDAGYKHAVLMGMGGSSLCSEVARETFGAAHGYLELLVLDNTAPEAIRDIERQIDMEHTLFIVASKSGNTKESISFFKYFYNQLKPKVQGNAGDNFIAITDAGTPLGQIAAEYKFRRTFINPSDIGGRYSVLSDFGLVPMALMGIDIKAILAGAATMKKDCSADIKAADNPGLNLGVTLGINQKHKRDKVTFLISPSISSFGLWVEQLLAESTGKEGQGLIPIEGEAAGPLSIYGNDRLFVYIYLAADHTAADEQKIQSFEKADRPVVRIELRDKTDLGGEYFRWEMATAVAGMVMDINPFDEPNVAESKKNTNDLLDDWNKDGFFKKDTPALTIGEINIYSSKVTKQTSHAASSAIADILGAFSRLIQPGDYLAFLPYFMLTDYRMSVLQVWREQMMTEHKMATTLLNGPRYLHSTGQLHKGGPNTGLYIMLIGGESDIAIPDEKYGFITFHEAQALGDFKSLDSKGRRVIYIDLGKNIDKGLDLIFKSVHP
jgi:transaldolase/glucose-6-phosphate isomerase